MAEVYCALVHHPVRDREGETVTTSVTNLDVHDIARSARTYGLRGYFVVTPITAQHAVVNRILEHWREGAGRERFPARTEAMQRVRVIDSLEDVVKVIEQECGRAPQVIATAAKPPVGSQTWSYVQAREQILGTDTPTLILYGTGHGLAQSALEAADALLAPIQGVGYNHLSVRAAVAITLDRLFGKYD